MPYHIEGLNHAGEQAFDDQTAHTTTHKIGGQIETLSGDPVDGIDGMVTNYQVNVNANTLVGRSATVTIFDKNRSLNLIDNSIYKQRRLKLWVEAYIIALDDTYRVPFFTGPFQDVQRADTGIQATCHGNARLALRAIRDTAKTIPKNTRIDDIAYTILVHWAGLQPGDIHIPRIPDRHPGAIQPSLNARPLLLLRPVLGSIAYIDFWDGDGHWWTSQYPTSPEKEWTGGQDGTILSRIVRNETDTDFWNVVDGHGANGLYTQSVADPKSPLSAQSLKITNTAGDVVLGWIPHETRNPNTKVKARLQQITDAQLARGLDNAFTYQFTARPWWRANEYDPATVNWRGDVAVFNMRRFGFSDSNVMTVGYNRVISFAGPRARFK